MKGIYVHIPFCMKKCGYCDFVSVNASEEFIEEYFESLEREINSFESKDMRVDSVFFGGGTPSFVHEKYIEQILNIINKKFCLSGESEITIECNPCSVTNEKLAVYKSCGINRISIGMQSADDKILEFLGRSHKYSDFLAAYENARKYFDNINIDVMLHEPPLFVSLLPYAGRSTQPPLKSPPSAQWYACRWILQPEPAAQLPHS